MNGKMSLSRELNHCLAPCGIPRNFLPAGKCHLPPAMVLWKTSCPVDDLLLLLVSLLTQESDPADKKWACLLLQKEFSKVSF